jgi:hypothetical protein
MSGISLAIEPLLLANSIRFNLAMEFWSEAVDNSLGSNRLKSVLLRLVNHHFLSRGQAAGLRFS